MPNNIQNNIKFFCSEERLREILESIMYDPNEDNEERGYGTIDFERITAMPPDLDIESGSRTTEGIEMYLTSLNPRATYFGKDKMNAEDFNALVTQINESDSPEKDRRRSAFRERSQVTWTERRRIFVYQ